MGLAVSLSGDLVPIPSLQSGSVVTSDSYMVGDGLATDSGYSLGGTDNTSGLRAAINAAAASESRTLQINAPLGKSLSSGLLIIGRQYYIASLVTGDDFSNVGSDTTNPYRFIATGTTPSVWTHGSVLQEILGTFTIPGTIDSLLGITIIGGASPGDIGGPAPSKGVPFAVRLIFSGMSGTALRLAQVASNQFRNLEIAGRGDTGFQVGRTMLVNSATNSTATVTVSGVNAFAFVVGMGVIGTGIPAATTVNTSITSGSATATVSSATGLASGMAVSGTGIPLGTTMTISGTTVTLSANATATNGTASLTFTPAITAVTGAPVRTACSTNSNTTLNVTGSTSGISNGMTVLGNGIPYGTTVSSGGGTATITLSKAATTTLADIFTFRGTQTVTLSNSATATNTLTDAAGLLFVDERFNDVGFTDQPGSNVDLDWCYIHGFGVNVSSNFVVGIRLKNCNLLNAQLAEARIENLVAASGLYNFQAGGDGEFTPSIGLSLVGHYASMELEARGVQLFNCSQPIDAAGACINATDLTYQGFIASGVGIDARGSSELDINGWSFAAMNGTCVGIKCHDATAVVTNVGAGPSATLSSVTHTSTTVDVTSTGLLVGMAVTGANISAGTWISAIPDSTHVTLNKTATSSTTLNLTFTPASIQTTFENKVRVLIPDPNNYIQTTDGSGVVNGQTTLADSASLMNRGSLTLPNGSTIGFASGTAIEDNAGNLYLLASGVLVGQIDPSGNWTLKSGGNFALPVGFALFANGSPFQQINFLGTKGGTQITDGSVQQLRIDTDGIHIHHAGTFTLVSGSKTVSDTLITANSVVCVTLKTASGTRAGNPDIVPTASTGFVATGAATDNGTYNYVVLESS